MEKIEFEGTQYVKASALAKDFRYTADYIGQLCRAKKVDARLVGRTWFVNPDSIKSHKKTKYQKKQPVEIKVESSDTAIEIKLNQVNVAPVLTSKTAKIINQASLTPANKSKKLHIFYDLDEEALLPSLIKKQPAPIKRLNVDPAGAKKVKIKDKDRDVDFKPSVLPDIALSGKLTISTYSTTDRTTEVESVENEEETDLKNKDELDNKIVNLTAKEVAGSRKKTIEIEKHGITEFKSKLSHKLKTSGKPLNKVVSMTKVAPAQALSNPSTEIGVKNESAELVHIPIAVMLSPVIATFIGLICALVLFSATSQIVVLDSVKESKITLQLANLLSVF